MTGRRGVSFIEVLVAGVAMVALVVPLLIVFSSTLRTTEVSLQEVWAQHLAAELMEQVKTQPFTVGFEWLFERPFPNPPPDYPNYLSLAPGGALACPGHAFPDATEWALDRTEELDTKGWTVTGAPLTFDTATPPDPLIAERSRLYLSPLPEGFRRFLQIYRPVRSLSPLAAEANLLKAVVRIEWSSARTTDHRFTRRIELRSLVGNPRIW